MWTLAAVYLSAIIFSLLLIFISSHWLVTKKKEQGAEAREGSFRAAQSLFLLAASVGILLISAPLFLLFRESLRNKAHLGERIELAMRTSIGPILLILLLLYANRKRATGWIQQLRWPKDER